MKRLLGLGLSLTLAVSMLAGCGSSSSGSSSSANSNENSSSGAESAETVVIQMGHANPGKEDDPYNKYCELFGEHLSELSGGKYQVEILADGQLGGERDMYEGLQMGTIDAALVTTMIVANFVPEYQFMDLPYLFLDYDDVHTVLDDDEIMADLEEASYNNYNVKILGYGENGFRKVLNSVKPINSLADYSGMKIRTPESSTYLDAFRAMGANPTAMAFSELYTGLSQKTVDGLELPIASINTKKFYEVAGYLSGTDHMFTAYAVCISGNFWDNLTEEEQGWFQQAADMATEEERVHVQAVEQKFLDEMVDAGLEYNEVENIDEIIAVCEGTWDNYVDTIGAERFDKILTALGRK